MRKAYAPKGVRAVRITHIRYQWVYLYAFVCPHTGETFWLILPTVDCELMSSSLFEFAAHGKISSTNRVLLVLDRAGFHTAHDIIVPEGIHLTYLPSHTPELQPAERLWSLSDEPLANQCFYELDTLIDLLSNRCKTLTSMQDTIKSLCNYSWIKKIAHHMNNVMN